MTQFDIIYDSSKLEPLQFYNTSTGQFISPSHAQSLSNQGLAKIVIGRTPTSSCSVILHDPDSKYWECFYNTETDKFLCEADANTLVQIGLGRIVAGKIPYIVTKEKGVYFDVVKNRKIGEETALQLVSSGVALLKDKDDDNGTAEEFFDASEREQEDNNSTTHQPSQSGNNIKKNAIALLHEFTHRHKLGVPSFQMLECPDANKDYFLMLVCVGSYAQQGRGSTKKLAKLDCSKKIYAELRAVYAGEDEDIDEDGEEVAIEEEEEDFVPDNRYDELQRNPYGGLNRNATQNSSAQPSLNSGGRSSTPVSSLLPSVPPSSLSSNTSASSGSASLPRQQRSTTRQVTSSPASAGTSFSRAEEEKEESFFDMVAPIAAGAAVAGVALAGVAAAIFFGSGGKDKKSKK